MTDLVLGNRFYGHREPGWHLKGTVDDIERTAREVYEDILGPMVVRKLALQTRAKTKDGLHIEVPYYGIIRGPISEDPNPMCFGTVSEDYVLVTPEQAVDLWDANVRRTVETAMYLRDGRQFILTCKLPEFNVKGDEVANYLMLSTMMDGTTASLANTSSVRVVCANTFAASISAATQQARFVHNRYILDKMGRWMEDVVDNAVHNLPALQQAYELLAEFKVEDKRQEASVIAAAYPTPIPPVLDPHLPSEVHEVQQKEYEAATRLTAGRRYTAQTLFDGRGTGANTLAAAGTMWGVYQAVVETEDYRKGSSGTALAHSILYGDRAATKRRAFDQAFAIAKGEFTFSDN